MNISSQFVEIRIPTKFMNSNWFIYFLHPLYSEIYLFPLLFLLSLPFSFLSSLPLSPSYNLFVEKKKTQDHFHVAVYFLTFMGSKTLQVLKFLRISTPHHRLRQNNFLDEFQCYWVNYFVVL